MAIPDFQSLMLPLLRLSSQGEVRLSEAIERLSTEFNLTQEERNALVPSKTQSIMRNRVAWAKTYLLKAGLLQATKRAYFTITDAGRSVLDSNISSLNNKYLMQFSEFKKFHQGKKNKCDLDNLSQSSDDLSQSFDKDLTPEELIHDSLKQIEEALGDEILTKIMAQSPEFFETLVVKLLLAMGYGGSFEEAGRALGKSGDGGIDGVIDQDILGLDSIYVQAKRYIYGNNVGSSAIRDFFGSLDKVKASKGLFVTTSDFTQDAKETVKFLSKRIVLINGRQLVKLMIRYGFGCRIEETLYIKKLDEDFFE